MPVETARLSVFRAGKRSSGNRPLLATFVYVNETKADAFHPDYVNYVGSKHDEFR
jgi:hypothetical protein